MEKRVYTLESHFPWWELHGTLGKENEILFGGRGVKTGLLCVVLTVLGGTPSLTRLTLNSDIYSTLPPEYWD